MWGEAVGNCKKFSHAYYSIMFLQDIIIVECKHIRREILFSCFNCLELFDFLGKTVVNYKGLFVGVAFWYLGLLILVVEVASFCYYLLSILSADLVWKVLSFCTELISWILHIYLIFYISKFSLYKSLYKI